MLAWRLVGGLACLLGILSVAHATQQFMAPLARGNALSGVWPRHENSWATGHIPLQVISTFKFACTPSSARLERAFSRYERIIKSQKTLWVHDKTAGQLHPLKQLLVSVPPNVSLDAPPQLHDDESFELDVNASGAWLTARAFGGVHGAFGGTLNS